MNSNPPKLISRLLGSFRTRLEMRNTEGLCTICKINKVHKKFPGNVLPRSAWPRFLSLAKETYFRISAKADYILKTHRSISEFGHKKFPGNVLFSHRVAPILSSPLRRLTTLFGMGRSRSTSLSSPGKIYFPYIFIL